MKTCWHHWVLFAIDGNIMRQAETYITLELSEAQQQVELLIVERHTIIEAANVQIDEASSVIDSLRPSRCTSGRSLPKVSLSAADR